MGDTGYPTPIVGLHGDDEAFVPYRYQLFLNRFSRTPHHPLKRLAKLTAGALDGLVEADQLRTGAFVCLATGPEWSTGSVWRYPPEKWAGMQLDPTGSGSLPFHHGCNCGPPVHPDKAPPGPSSARGSSVLPEILSMENHGPGSSSRVRDQPNPRSCSRRHSSTAANWALQQGGIPERLEAFASGSSQRRPGHPGDQSPHGIVLQHLQGLVVHRIV